MAIRTVQGFVARSPEMRYTAAGDAVTNILMGVEGGIGMQFIRLTFWREDAEAANDDLRSGTRIEIEGDVRERTYKRDDDSRGVQTVCEPTRVKILEYPKRDQAPVRWERPATDPIAPATGPAPEGSASKPFGKG